MVYTILASSYANEVYTLEFDPKARSLKTVSSVTVGFQPSWVVTHPDDPTLAFVNIEDDIGSVVAIKYEGVVGKVVGQISTQGSYPASILVTKDTLFAGNYASGNLHILSISTTAPYFQADLATQTLQFSGTGPDASRQESSHPHQVLSHPEREELFVPDLGADKTWRLSKSKEGWNQAGSIEYPAGSGPRHVAFYGGHLYTILELSSEVSVHSLPELPAAATLQSIAPTQFNPPSRPTEMLGAEILIPAVNASFTTPYIFATNRNGPGSEGDTIAVFSLDKPEAPKLIAEIPSGLKHLRSIVFGGPDDKYLIAGGARGGGVRVFERVDGGKGLKFIAEDVSVEKPTGFVWV